MLSQRLCRDRVVCQGSDSPFANLSSEANDPALFLGVQYCWGVAHQWYPRLCWSDVNTLDANSCASNICFLSNPGWPFGIGFGSPPETQVQPPNPVIDPLTGVNVGPPAAPPDVPDAPIQEPPGSDNYVTPPEQVIVWNEEQTCTVCIPDGPCYTYVCAAGTFYAIVQP